MTTQKKDQFIGLTTEEEPNHSINHTNYSSINNMSSDIRQSTRNVLSSQDDNDDDLSLSHASSLHNEEDDYFSESSSYHQRDIETTESTESNKLIPKHDETNGDDTMDEEDEFDDREMQDGLKNTTSPLHHKGAIGMLGSVAIAVNSLTGPAMINLPYLFQQAGFFPVTITLALICVLSTLCALHLSNAISKIPGNRNFHQEIEYSETFRYYWGQKAFVFSHITFYCCITCLNIASIVDTAQVVDEMLSRQLKGGAIALSLSEDQAGDDVDSNDNMGMDSEDTLMGEQRYMNDATASKSLINWTLVRWNRSTCYLDDDDIVTGGAGESGDSLDGYDDMDYDNCIPFQTDTNGTSWLVTLGYLLAALCFLPMSLQDLKENTAFQIFGFIVLLVLSAQFIFTFIQHGIDINNLSMWGEDYSDLFGVCLFNFAVVVAVPAWLYEKKPSVKVSTALNGSSLMAFVLYVVVGSLGAMTMKNVDDNMLQSMMSGAFGPTTEIASMAFAFFIIGLGIPLFSVLVRMNLTGSGLCSNFVANILAVYLPWGISWIFYSGGATALLGWGGIIFTSIIAFLAPLSLALYAESKVDGEGSIPIYGDWKLTKRQKIIILYALLLFSIASIILAVFGELYQ